MIATCVKSQVPHRPEGRPPPGDEGRLLHRPAGAQTRRVLWRDGCRDGSLSFSLFSPYIAAILVEREGKLHFYSLMQVG